jgi:hypothetical protein
MFCIGFILTACIFLVYALIVKLSTVERLTIFCVACVIGLVFYQDREVNPALCVGEYIADVAQNKDISHPVL